VLDELVLPDSNTRAACEEFLTRTAKWKSVRPLEVHVYGDATAEHRETSASRTDWQIVRSFFGPTPICIGRSSMCRPGTRRSRTE